MDAPEEQLETLRRQVDAGPDAVDLELLCTLLASDDHDVASDARTARNAFAAAVQDPDPVVATLFDVVATAEAGVASEAVDLLGRITRLWPLDAPAGVADRLAATDERSRLAACLALRHLPSGAVEPHVGELHALLDDDFERVRANALRSIQTVVEAFPGSVVTTLPDVEQFFAERWIPSDPEDGYRAYRMADGDPETNGLVRTEGIPAARRPLRTTLALLDEVVEVLPGAVADAFPELPGLVETVGDVPNLRKTLLGVTFALARHDPSLVEPYVGPVERLVTEGNKWTRVHAMNVLVEVGRPVPTLDPVTVPEMATRDGQVVDGDLQRAKRLEGRLRDEFESVDLDDVHRLLRSEDAEVRDHAAFGVEQSLLSTRQDRVHPEASRYLALVNEPDDDVRRHLVNGLGYVVRVYPTAFTPTLVELLGHPDAYVRQSVVLLLDAAFEAFPAGTREHVSDVATFLDDERPVRAAVFLALESLAAVYPNDVGRYLPAAMESLDAAGKLRFAALGYVRALAEADLDAAAPATEPLVEFVADRIRPDSIDDRATWGREEFSADPDWEDRSVEVALEALVWLARDEPETIAVDPEHLETVVDRRTVGWEATVDLIRRLATVE